MENKETTIRSIAIILLVWQVLFFIFVYTYAYNGIPGWSYGINEMWLLFSIINLAFIMFSVYALYKKYNSAKILSIILLILSIIGFVLMTYPMTQENNNINLNARSCSASYGGICQEACAGDVATTEITNCNTQGMMCCKVIG